MIETSLGIIIFVDFIGALEISKDSSGPFLIIRTKDGGIFTERNRPVASSILTTIEKVKSVDLSSLKKLALEVMKDGR